MDLARETARAKRQCADKGYYVDAFAAQLAEPTADRGDPLLRRGYYARHRAVDAAVRAFAAAFPGRAQVVALGCGLDTTFWRLHATGVRVAAYLEVDSPVVVAEKQRLIRLRPALLAAAGPRAAGGAGAAAGPPTAYRLTAADLRDAAAVDAALRAEGLDPSRPTLVLAECVLAYLAPEAGDALVAWAKTTFADALVVAYDVVKATPEFSRVMVRNFRDRGAPLLGAAESLDAVRARFGAFATVDVRDMKAVFAAFVEADPTEFRRVARIEIFDDPHQFDMLMAHYCFVVAGAGACAPLAGGAR